MSEPELWLFPISHYCEKARWALDHHGVAHRVRPLVPGPHPRRVRRLGVDRSSVPVLVTTAGVIQGSAEIVDWCDTAGTDPERSLTPAALETASRELEARFDSGLGVQVRRHAYSVMLFEAPEQVRAAFTSEVPFGDALVLRVSWPIVRGLMVRGMDLGPQQRLEARDAISAELDWLDEQLVDGRPFLLGDRFTRADLAAASLLSPIAAPPERPFAGTGPTPAALAEDVDEWSARPSIAWVRSVYRALRRSPAAA